jgi:hypothetical protein
MARHLTFGSEQLAAFKRQGYIKLQGMFDPAEIQELRRWCSEPIWTQEGPGGLPGFANTRYAPDQRTVFEQLAEDEELRATLRQLSEERLIYTTGNRFTVTESSGGSPWHFDRQSFCHIQPLDPGYSLWVPLDPIRVHAQHGGLVWVSDDNWSGRERLQQWAGHLRRVGTVSAREQAALLAALREQYGEQRSFPMLGAYDHAFLELFGQSDDFEVGDALLFTKFLWHRTAPLQPGPLRQRLACVLRYVSEQATLARDLMDAALAGMDDKTRREAGHFGSFLTDIPNGALLRASAHCPQPR